MMGDARASGPYGPVSGYLAVKGALDILFSFSFMSNIRYTYVWRSKVAGGAKDGIHVPWNRFSQENIPPCATVRHVCYN